jgi:hypothetical protein
MNMMMKIVGPMALVAMAGASALAQCDEPKWVQMNVAGPSARTAHGMAWDDVTQRVILFGGAAGANGARLNDTWAWDGFHWTQQIVGAGTPIARSNHAMGTWAGRAAMFGGTSNGSDRLDDLRIFFNGVWAGIVTTGTAPTGRAFHSMGTIGSGTSSQLVMIGGTNTNCSQTFDGFKLNANAQWVPFTPPSNLAKRTFAGLVSIEGLGNNDFAILQGNVTPCGTASAGNTIWHNALTDAYNVVQGNAPQPARWNAATASSWNDPNTPRKGYVQFGGDRGNAFNLLSETWHTRENTPGGFNTFAVTGPAPSARRNHGGMAWDMARDQYVMFGGNDQQGNALGDTWVLTFKPIFTTAASARHLCVSRNATFSAPADGPGTISYQWFYNGLQIVNGLQASGMFIIGATTANMLIVNLQPVLTGTLTCVASNGCGATTSQSFPVVVSQCELPCGPIDINGNGVFPEDLDVIDFFNTLAGGQCSTGNCYPIDFNGNGVFPEDADVISFFRVLAGGSCN